jgi:hypothetical protein
VAKIKRTAVTSPSGPVFANVKVGNMEVEVPIHRGVISIPKELMRGESVVTTTVTYKVPADTPISRPTEYRKLHLK